MRDYRDAKVMARALRTGLKDQKLTITHSQSLELVAKAFGYDNWNILAAKIDEARPAVEPAQKGAETLYSCSFCGKSQHVVKTLIAGPDSFICNECVSLCDDIIEHGAVLSLLAADEAEGGEAAGFPRLSAYLAERTSEQIRAYLTKIEVDQSRTREALATGDEAIAARAEGRTITSPWGDKSDAHITAQRGTLNKHLAGSQRVAQIVTRALEARG